MVLLITGATGGLGRVVLETLNALQIPKESYMASTTSLARLPADLSNSGVRFVEADYDRPDSLDTAFSGVTRLLMVSTNTFDVDRRVRQHRAAIDAAKRAGVRRVVYTSLAFGDQSQMSVMAAHLQTEAYLRQSGVDYTIIREGTYVDAFPLFLDWFPDTTAVELPGDGPVAWTSRAELGEATARVLLDDTDRFHNDKIVLTAQETLDLRGVARVVGESLGREIAFSVVSPDDYLRRKVGRDGVPEWLARAWASTYAGLALGEGATVSPLLEELLGRQPTPASQWIAATLAANPRYTWHQLGGGGEH